MAFEKGICLKVNEPNVVHETIDGEAILLNLSTGNYYSIEWPGTLIWDLLCESGDPEEIKKAFISISSKEREQIEKALNGFVDKLYEEELIVPFKNGAVSALEVDIETEQELKKASTKLDKLEINKYSDMQDMLLLDPIHDVDKKGWPEPKKEK